MRILTINYECPPLGGGGGVAAMNLASEFARQGHSVIYLTSHFADLAREETVNGIRIVRVPVLGRRDLRTASMPSMLSFPIAAVPRGLRLARKERFDVVHSHFAIPSGPAGWALSKWLRRPHVLSIHGGDIYDPSKSNSPHRHASLRATVRAVLNQATVIVPQSSDTERRAREIYRPRKPFVRIPLGFVPQSFERVSREQLGLRPDGLYAIAVSRLVARKGYPDLLRALQKAGVDNLELLIIGEGPEETKLRALAQELGVAERTHFLGYVEGKRKLQYLSAADMFTLASLHEGYGIVFQEAMYCGLPIVTTNVGGQTDFLTDGQNALLTPPSAPEAMTASLIRLANDTALRREMGRRNAKEIEGQSIEHAARKYLQLFEDVISRHDAH